MVEEIRCHDTDGMVIKFIFDLLYPLTPFEMVEVSGIGVVIPGIIANTIQNKV